MKPASRRRVPLQSAHVLSFYNQEQSWQRSNTSHSAEDDGWCHSTELQLVRGSSFVLRFPMRVERITPAARGWSAPSHVASASWHRGLNRISGISVGRFRRVHCRSFTRPGRAGLWQLSPGRGTGAALSAVFVFFSRLWAGAPTQSWLKCCSFHHFSSDGHSEAFIWPSQTILIWSKEPKIFNNQHFALLKHLQVKCSSTFFFQIFKTPMTPNVSHCRLTG